MTCNAQWPEMINNMQPYGISSDHSELIARFFKAKKIKKLDEDIMKNHISAGILDELMFLNFPHIYFLIWLCKEDKIRTSEDVDRIISAEITVENKYPRLERSLRNS